MPSALLARRPFFEIAHLKQFSRIVIDHRILAAQGHGRSSTVTYKP